MERFTGLLGLMAIVAAAYVFSSNRRAIQRRVIFWGLGLQFGFAFLVLKTKFGYLFKAAADGVNYLLAYASEGSKFVFGDKLGVKNDQFGVVFAFQVLPIVIFIASLFAILYYLGIMQVVVRGMAIGMQKVMGTSGAESTNVAASIFMGQTEAPLTIRPFLADLTQSELFTVMASGMAHVSGAVMAAYVVIAEWRSAPSDRRHYDGAGHNDARQDAAARTGKPVTAGNVHVEVEKPGVNIIDAAARGAGDGLQLALNIGGMLIAFWVSSRSSTALRLGSLAAFHGLVTGLDAGHPRRNFRAGVVATGRELERRGDYRRPARHAAHFE